VLHSSRRSIAGSTDISRRASEEQYELMEIGSAFACPNPKVKETFLLTSPRSRDILGTLDILVDIGVPAEKEVIQ
jgi:hypothetical protein